MLDNGNLEVSSEQHFFRIGQVCRLTDIKSFTLRYWESEFPSLQPVKSSKGQRLYRREDVETVLRIKRLLYDEGFTIAGARRYLRDLEGSAPQNTPPAEATGDFERASHPAPRSEAPAQYSDLDFAASEGVEEEDEAGSQFAGSHAAEHRDVTPAPPLAQTPAAPPPASRPASTSSGKDASAMLSRKLLLDLRDSLRAFLTLLENE